jgi:hypothetical protein
MPGIVEIDAADDRAQRAKEQTIDPDSVPCVLAKEKPIPLSAPLRTGTLVAAILKGARFDGTLMRRQIDPHYARHVPQPPLTRTIAESSRIECRGMSGESQRV